jgi:UDP-N-acetylmuramate--alanine ligase
MKIFGKHNILNAQAAYLCAKAVGVDEDQIKRSLHNFSGTSRRFEFKGEVNGIKIFDDYAHHPAEVAATLTAAREKFPNERLWCVFQPHTFSRTEALFDDFVKSFEESSVDKLVIVDIYAAREQPKNISSLDMAKKIRGKAAVYIGEIEEAATYVAKNASSGDIIIAMGAGDIYKLSQMLLNKLKGQNGRKRFS